MALVNLLGALALDATVQSIVNRLPAALDADGGLKAHIQSAIAAKDFFTAGEVLADQSGAGTVLTYSFTAPVQLVYVKAVSAAGNLVARVDPYGGTPSASQGIPCGDGETCAMPVQASGIKVYAPSGMTVSVWGSRY